MLHRLFKIVGAPQGIGQGNVGEIPVVGMPTVDFLDYGNIPCPKHCVGLGAGQSSQRRAPAAGTQNDSTQGLCCHQSLLARDAGRQDDSGVLLLTLLLLGQLLQALLVQALEVDFGKMQWR